MAETTRLVLNASEAAALFGLSKEGFRRLCNDPAMIICRRRNPDLDSGSEYCITPNTLLPFFHHYPRYYKLYRDYHDRSVNLYPDFCEVLDGLTENFNYYDWYTAVELQDIWGLSERQVRRWRNKGYIKFVNIRQVGYISEHDLVQFFAAMASRGYYYYEDYDYAYEPYAQCGERVAAKVDKLLRTPK